MTDKKCILCILYTQTPKQFYRRELQRIQNNGLRTCLLYNRIEHITIERMHNEMKIVSLEQRWQNQLLKLMYRISSNDVYIKKSGVNTRGKRNLS